MMDGERLFVLLFKTQNGVNILGGSCFRFDHLPRDASSRNSFGSSAR